MHRLLADPWVAARVDDALAPFAGTVSAAELAWMRDRLAEKLETDPVAARALRRAAPRAVDKSGEVPSEGTSAQADVDAGDDRDTGTG